MHKNGNRIYTFLVLGRKGPYFVKEHSDSKNEYTEDDIIYMLEFLVDNIFVVFVGKVGPYCKLNLIKNGVYIFVEVSFNISNR